MNQREKLLVVLVALCGFAAAAFWIGLWVEGQFAQRRQNLENARQQVQQKMQKIIASRRDTERLRDYESRSLPRNAESARSSYNKWLLDSVNQHQWEGPSVQATRPRRRGDKHQELMFSVAGKADLQQLTAWMHQFYASGYLHRIRSLSIKPLRNEENETRDLDIRLSVEALALSTAEQENELPSSASQPQQFGDLAAYKTTILSRNLFGPPNQPPRLSSISTQQVELGSSVYFSVRGYDSDKLDKVKIGRAHV